MAMLRWNKTFWLAVESHTTCLNQSDCIIPAKHSCTTLKFVYDIASWFPPFRKKYFDQWLWLSWLSSHLWHQRSAVRIQASANFYWTFVYCQLGWKDENEEKEAGNIPLKKTNYGQTWICIIKMSESKIVKIILQSQ